MIDHSSELQLAWCVLLNFAVFGSAWLFTSRRVTRCRSQALFDAVLLGYGSEYVAVGLPGMLGQLHPFMIAMIAMLLSAGLTFTALMHPLYPQSVTERASMRQSLIVAGIAIFPMSFVLAFIHAQALLSVMSNDAMTYHIPAAAQWLQHGRIDLFQTWFFNPANTFSPLAGSTFITWLIAPFGSDVMARFVEVPALACVGLGMYRLVRQLRCGAVPASLIAAAAMLCRPLFFQSIMAKDDLFVAFFFIAALVALTPERSDEKFGPCRLGIAVGLLLATKYTVMLTMPVLLLATGGFGRNWRAWVTATAIATCLTGPWYLRNIWLTGNPLFPMQVGFLRGLFTTTSSDAFGSFRSSATILIGGEYSLPIVVIVLLVIGWLAAIASGLGKIKTDPLLRVCLLGPMVGTAIFYLLSPFPEVRFVVPEFLLLFAATGFAIGRLPDARLQAVGASLLFIACVATVIVHELLGIIIPFILTGLSAGILIMGLLWGMWHVRRRNVYIGGGAGIIFASVAYVNWAVYVRDYKAARHDDASGYAIEFPAEEKLWRFVYENIPADATIAYTNLYLISPLQGFDLRRRLVYAPTRARVQSIADLPWVGSHLSGEKLVRATIRATVALPDHTAWLNNLKSTGADYLLIGRGGVIDTPPELAFAQRDSRFRRIFECESGTVYAVGPR